MSTATIVQRVFTQVPEKAIQIGGVNFLRPLAIGSNWFRIRIGLLCSINASATLQGTTFYFGLSSSFGPGSGWLNTGKWVGAIIQSTNSFNFNAGAGNPYFAGAANVTVGTRFDQTFLYNLGGAALPHFAAAGQGSRLRRTPIFVDFTRATGNSNYTVTVYGCSFSTVLQDYRPDHFFAGLDTWTTPVCNGQTMTSLATSAAVGMVENVGPFDVFDIFWPKALYPLEIYAMGASVFLEKPVPYQGSVFTGAYESFASYGTGSNCPALAPNPFLGTVLGSNAVSPWSAGTIIGYSFSPQFNFPVAFAGTTGGAPFEAFDYYGTGTVYQSGLVLDRGQLWTGAGTVLTSN